MQNLDVAEFCNACGKGYIQDRWRYDRRLLHPAWKSADPLRFDGEFPRLDAIGPIDSNARILAQSSPQAASIILDTARRQFRKRQVQKQRKAILGHIYHTNGWCHRDSGSLRRFRPSGGCHQSRATRLATIDEDWYHRFTSTTSLSLC